MLLFRGCTIWYVIRSLLLLATLVPTYNIKCGLLDTGIMGLDNSTSPLDHQLYAWQTWCVYLSCIAIYHYDYMYMGGVCAPT